MPDHDYTPQQALQMLLEKLDESVPDLANRIRTIINEGKIAPVDPKITRGKLPVRPSFEKRKFTEQEALLETLNVLQAYFVDLPACIRSLENDFAAAAAAVGETQPYSPKVQTGLEGEVKEIHVDFRGETAILDEAAPAAYKLSPPTEDSLEEQQLNVAQLQSFLDFS